MKKKNILALVSLILLVMPSFAQVTKGDLIIDGNIGILGGRKGVIYTLIENYEASEDINIDGDLKTNYQGPIGGRVEYMTNEEFAFGLEANYTSRYAEWTNISKTTEYNEATGENETVENKSTYSISQTVLRIMFRVNYIFVNDEKLQLMYSNSLGYRMAQWKVNPDYELDQILTLSSWPLAFRTAVGMRYWIIDNLGVNAEIGFSGGAYVNGGLSLKLKGKSNSSNTEPF